MATTSPQSFSSQILPSKFGNFDLIRSERLELGDILVSKYRSRETGLTVVHLDYEGVWRSFLQERSSPIILDTSTSCEWILCCANRKYVSVSWCEVIIDRESRASVFNDSGCPHTLEQ